MSRLLLLALIATATAIPLRYRIKDHCGPRDIPSSHSQRIAQQLAREIEISADFVYNDIRGGNSRLTKEAIRQWMIIGSAVRELSEGERIANIAAITAEMMEKKLDVIKFMATYEVNRIERWAKDMLLIGLNPTALIPKLMDLPFEIEERWRHSNSEERFNTILDAILKDLCPLKL